MKNNCTEHILSHMPRAKHRRHNHPIEIVKRLVAEQFPGFFLRDTFSPFVSVVDCFDRLRIPADHPSRSMSDTYYFDDETVLRTHMTAHTVPMADTRKGEGLASFLTCGEVYRRDEIDRTHYPVFHQLDGFCVTPNAAEDLLARLLGVAKALFPNVPVRVLHEGVDAGIYFPFTTQSIEIEVELNGQWVEILGGGVVHPDIMKAIGRKGEEAWAFGMGLERIAMAIWDIPDIRLFWSIDSRFLDQFSYESRAPFKPFSNHPVCYKDIAFWYDGEIQDNDLYEIVRGIAPDIIEQIKLLDTFTHPKTGRKSKCYRMDFRDLYRTLTNIEVNDINDKIREAAALTLNVELR